MAIIRSKIARQLLAEGGVSLDDAKAMAPEGEFLAYINPKEAKMLKDAGGSGVMTPMGIPSFVDFGRPGSEEQQASFGDQAAMNQDDYESLDQEGQQEVDQARFDAGIRSADFSNLQPPSFLENLSDSIGDRRGKSIQSFIQKSTMNPLSAIRSTLTREKLPEELFIDLYREDEKNKGLFSEGFVGGKFDMEKTKNLLDTLTSPKDQGGAGFDRNKSIKEQSGNMTQTEFNRVFPGPQTGGDSDSQEPIRLRQPIAEKIEEPREGTFDDILKFYGAKFEDGGEVRQAYGLGSIVKKATRAVKKIVKSPVGKAALFGAAAFGLPAIGSFQGTPGFLQSKLGKKIFFSGKDAAFENLNPFSAITAASILAGTLSKQDEEEEEKLPTVAQSDPEFQKFIDFYGGPTRFAAEGGDIEDAPMGDRMASAPSSFGELNQLSIDLFGRPYDQLNDSEQEILMEYFTRKSPKPEGIPEPRAQAAEGGMMDLGGNEMDLRGGGFVPLGAKEKADDVPARLSKNEFVMTADAVRAAGGGSVDRGADIMYKTMKTLENKVA